LQHEKRSSLVSTLNFVVQNYTAQSDWLQWYSFN